MRSSYSLPAFLLGELRGLPSRLLLGREYAALTKLDVRPYNSTKARANALAHSPFAFEEPYAGADLSAGADP
jgi:hypothetical protein